EVVDLRDYLRVVQIGTATEAMMALRDIVGYHLTFQLLDAKINARKATKFNARSGKKPKFTFTSRFFTKLGMFPAVTIEVRESRSYIRKTCYGWRDPRTGER